VVKFFSGQPKTIEFRGCEPILIVIDVLPWRRNSC
jgi:hypothetical protein